MRTTPFTVLEINGQEVRLLKGSWPALSDCAYQAVGTDVTAVLKRLAGQGKGGRAPCVLVIPRRETVLKVMDVPSRDPREILCMIGLQIPVIVPFEETQVVYQYRRISGDEAGTSKIVAAIVLEQVIQKHIDCVSAAGWTVTDVRVDFDGSLNYAQNFLSQYFHGIGLGAFVGVGEQYADVLVVSGGQPVFSFTVPCGRTDADKDPEQFVGALKQALMVYEKTFKESFGIICFDARFTELEKVRVQMARGGDVRIDVIDCFSAMPEAHRSFIEENRLDASWIPLLGCLVTENGFELMDFLPKRLRALHGRRKLRRKIISFAGALLSAAIVVGGVLGAMIYNDTAKLKALKDAGLALEPRLAGMQTENNFFDMIAREKGRDRPVLDMVKEIYGLLPEDVSLQDFVMPAEGEFEIQGVAVRDESVNQLQAALAALQHFQNVNLHYATKRRRFDRECTEFKLTFEQVDR